jgi:hypothetical protein
MCEPQKIENKGKEEWYWEKVYPISPERFF